MVAPSGPGVFIWQPRLCEGGDPYAVGKKAAAVGLRWLALQNFYSSTYVSALKSFGLWVGYSGYVTPQSTRNFVSSAKLAQAAGVDGVLVDAELEWELADDRKTIVRRGDDATRFAQALRAAVGPDLFLGDAGCWAEPKFHPTYPDVEFGACLDAGMPERYWTESTTPYDRWMAESEREWQVAGKLYASVIPIGSAYGTNGPVPGGHQPLQPKDFEDFIRRYPTFGLWSWMHCPTWAWQSLSELGPYKIPIATPDVPLDPDPLVEEA